jgi:hypothetical protein
MTRSPDESRQALNRLRFDSAMLNTNLHGKPCQGIVAPETCGRVMSASGMVY